MANRVSRVASLLARRAGLASDACRDLEFAARLHDIGKVAVPDPDPFTSAELREAERKQMRSHAVIGAEILGRSCFDKLQLAEQIARHHHEWWDGTGYPSRLSGKRIPIHARIVALADVFDALTHGRAYAPAWSIDHALEEIRGRRGTQFDPDLTDLFLALMGTCDKSMRTSMRT
jgi:putative two-component system response regulator